jgi:Domain of unknown function (DUF397)
MNLNNAEWRKSSYSGGNGGQCVEVAANLPGIVAVRDSKDPDGPALAVEPKTFGAFVQAIKNREFS